MKHILTATLVAAILHLSGCSRTVSPPSALESRVRRVLELPTYEYVYRDVIYFDEERSYIIFKSKKAVLFSVNVRVQAGLDLTQGISVRRRGLDGIIVSIPPAEILHIDADESSIHEYFVEERFDDISLLDYYDELDRSKHVIRNDAVQRGILARADENARGLIRGVLSRAGYDQIVFEQVAP